jgi:Cof subfamily protein (haloacid dehalogenase superfamily)
VYPDSDTAMACRLVATDLDGTLLRGDKTVSARTREALRGAQAAGIVVAIVAGRPPRTARVIAREIGVSGLAICCNGGIVYDLAADEILLDEMMPGEVAQRLVAEIRAAVPGVCFATERGLHFGHEPAYTATSTVFEDTEPLCDDAHALCAEGVTKLIVRHTTMPIEELWAVTREIAGDAATATHSGAPFIEVSATGITKASALAHVCDRLGIAQSATIAIGDMPNDLPMLAWAGHSVAVANAHPDVRAAVDEITASNEEDGVALVLERLFGEGIQPPRAPRAPREE